MPDLAYTSIHQKIVPLEEATIPVLDRGFLFADAVYEVIRVYNSRPFLLKEHLARLSRNLKELQIPLSALASIPKVISALIEQSGHANARLYIQITRGIGKRQLAFDDSFNPTVVVFIESLDVEMIEVLQQEGVSLITHPDLRWSRCDIKSTGLLPNLLAHQQAVNKGAFDALLIDPDGFIRETTHASFFAVLNGNVLVPPVNDHLLPGITRSLVLRLTESLNIPVILRKTRIQELNHAEEAFLTATSTEIIPVIRIDDRFFPYAENIDLPKAGPITQKLQTSYKRIVRQQLT